MSKLPYCVHRQWLLIGLLGLIVGLGAGCAHFQRLPVKNSAVLDDHEGLTASFSRYWRLIARKEVEKALDCEAPHVREIIGLDAYALYQNLFMKADLQEVEVLAISCERDFLCHVDCRLIYKANGHRDTRERRDFWLRLTDGAWYHVLKNPMLLPQLGG